MARHQLRPGENMYFLDTEVADVNPDDVPQIDQYQRIAEGTYQ